MFPSIFSPPIVAPAEYEFGTNTGRQGTFNRENQDQVEMAIARLRELEQQYSNKLDFKFTGSTGLANNDADGYSKMLNARTEAANIKRILDGQSPLQIAYGGTISQQAPKQGRSITPTGNLAQDIGNTSPNIPQKPNNHQPLRDYEPPVNPYPGIPTDRESPPVNKMALAGLRRSSGRSY